jgi:L-rhamnose mutarotase
MKRYVLTVDLKDDPAAIAQYRRYHQAVWPEVQASLRRVGVRSMDIYGLGRRLTMVMETRDDFDLSASFADHAVSSSRCAELEELMKTFQEAPPGARPGDLWARMDPVFHLERPSRERPPRAVSARTAVRAPRRRRG